jgi:hypothetical protein
LLKVVFNTISQTNRKGVRVDRQLGDKPLKWGGGKFHECACKMDNPEKLPTHGTTILQLYRGGQLY